MIWVYVTFYITIAVVATIINEYFIDTFKASIITFCVLVGCISGLLVSLFAWLVIIMVY